jgi:peptide/nickel transport system substrate-binding protein
MRTARKARLLLAAAAALALTLAACSDDDDSAEPGDTAGAATADDGTSATEATVAGDTTAEGPGGTDATDGTPQEGGKIIIGTTDEPTLGFYPATSAVGAGGNTIAMGIFDTLSAVDADGNFVPYLAESIEPNEDNTVWTITLRAGTQFADGTPLDAAALKDNFDRMEAAGRPIEAGFTSAVVDEMTVAVTFPAPYGPFVAAVSSPYAWIASSTAMAEMSEEEFDENPIGTGPYVIKEWVRDDHLTLERNPNYWRADEGLPHLDEIEFRPIIEDDVRLAALEAGDVDAIIVGPNELPDLRERADEFNLAEVTQGVEAVVFNNGLPLFQDERVRKGLCQAIDVQALIDGPWKGIGTLATGPIPSDSPWSSDVEYPRYDAEAARTLLEEYTAETGQPVAFTLSYGEGVDVAETAQLLQ